MSRKSELYMFFQEFLLYRTSSLLVDGRFYRIDLLRFQTQALTNTNWLSDGRYPVLSPEDRIRRSRWSHSSVAVRMYQQEILGIVKFSELINEQILFQIAKTFMAKPYKFFLYTDFYLKLKPFLTNQNNINKNNKPLIEEGSIFS